MDSPAPTSPSFPTRGHRIAASRTALLLALLTLGFSPAADAGIVTLDFDEMDPTWVFQTDPYLENGFRISVLSCHYDTGDPARNRVDGTQFMAFDVQSCASEARLRLDYFGETFSLLDLDIPAVGFDAVLSSLGGTSMGCANQSLPNSICAGALILGGAPWTDVTWVDFVVDDIGEPVTGFDNLRLMVDTVDEPHTLALIAGAMLAFLLSRRSRRSGASDRRRRAGGRRRRPA